MDLNNHTRIPIIRLQPVSVGFIEDELDDFHPGFAYPPSHYDASLNKFVLDEPVSEMGEETLAFQSRVQLALASTQVKPVMYSTAPPPPAPVPTARNVLPVRRRVENIAELKFWDKLFEPSMARFVKAHETAPPDAMGKSGIRDQTDWTGVFERLQTAKNAYIQGNGDSPSRFRMWYRKFADSSGVPLSVVKTAKGVVENDYASPVLGALQLVLEAADRAAKLRQDMLGTFANIHRNFAEIEVYHLQTFVDDESIKDASIDLVASVLYAIEITVAFFASKTYKRAVKATILVDNFREKIDKSLKDIEEKTSALLREVNMSAVHRNYHFHELAIQESWSTQQSVAQLQNMLHVTRNGFMDLINDLTRGMAGFEAKLVHGNKDLRDLRADFAQLFLARPVTSESVISAAQSPEPETYCITPQELLNWIDIPDLATDDLDCMINHNYSHISEAEQGRAQQLITNVQLRDWLSIPESSQLLIHGNEIDGLRPVSGLSLLCASLLMSLAHNARIIRLFFFCGFHIDGNNGYDSDGYLDDDDESPTDGGCALITSFICQLLCAFDFGPVLPVDPRSEGAVRDWDLDELCSIFSTLVHQLPPGVVLISVVDGAAYYERPKFFHDAAVVFAHILRLSIDDSVSAVVKILITCATHTTHIRQPFPAESILSMAAMADAEWEPSQARIDRILKAGEHACW